MDEDFCTDSILGWMRQLTKNENCQTILDHGTPEMLSLSKQKPKETWANC